MGSVGQSDSTSLPAKKRRGYRIQIKNIPVELPKENIENIVSQYGTVLRCELVSDAPESYFSASYETAEQAQSAVEQMNGLDVQGHQLQVQLLPDNAFRNRKYDNPRFTQGSQAAANSRTPTVPLRILVPSELVGAVIGKKGVTIKNITTQCKARVDVHGKENSGLVEKLMSIFGQPENCSNACKEIMKVIHNEPAVVGRGATVPLKMLIDDRYCGRIIGKEGKIIKKIRDETNTKITISSMQEMAVIYPDRVITVQGNVDNMVAAQAAISAKLVECIEKEMQACTNGVGAMMLMPSAMPMMPPVAAGGPYPQAHPGIASGYQQAYGTPNLPPYSAVPPHVDVCQIVVPDKAVGAIIGAGGSMIKQIMEDSNAYVTVEPRKEGDAAGSPLERIVTIRGNPDASWKASYFIFEKVKDESAGAAAAATAGGAGDSGEIKLRTMITVPRTVAGKIIGRQGKNVREIQRMTGATVKLSEDATGQKEEVTAEIYGNFMATQGAHSRIRALISEDLSDGCPMYPQPVQQPNQQQRGPQRRGVQQQA
jgi:insulin-like growth factor 2 mRNA-binding protein 1